MLRITACGCLAALVSASAFGQSIAVPQAQGGLVTPGAGGRWGLATTLLEEWIRSTGLETLSNEDRFISNLQLTLSHNRKVGRGQFSISGSGIALRDHLLDDTILTYAGNVGFVQPMSRSVSLNLLASSSYAFARDVPVLSDAGLVVPLDLTRTNSAGAGLGLRLSQQVTASFDGRYDEIDYRARDTNVDILSFGGSLACALTLNTHLNFDGRFDRADFSQAGLEVQDPLTSAVDGRNLLAGATLAHQFSQASGLSLRYGYQHSRARIGRNADTHSLTAGWNWNVGPRVNVNLGGGASYYDLRFDDLAAAAVPVPSATGWTPNATAGLTVKLPPTGTFNVRYQRTVQPVFGYGEDVTADHFAASYNRVFGRRFEAAATASYGIRQGLGNDGFDLRTTTAGSHVQWVLSRNFSLAGGYEYRHNSRQGPFARPTSHVGTASLTYGYDWR